MLKSTLMTLALAGVTFAAAAQVTVVDVETNKDNSNLKPMAGANNVEVLLNPFTSDPVRLFDGFKYRYFLTDKSALRLVANLSWSRTTTMTSAAGNGAPDLYMYDNAYGITIRPGYEKHFGGTRRISPYIGGEVIIGSYWTNKTEESYDGNSVVESTTKNDGGYLRLGVNALTGVDVYVCQNFYLGTELGFGIGYTNPYDTKTKPAGGSETATKVGKPATFSLGFYAIPALRLGYIL